MSTVLKDIRLNAAPPVSERPRCPNCDKVLSPMWRTVKSEKVPFGEGGGHSYQDTMEWRGEFHGYGAFCTLRCCEAFANLAYKAGYRRKHGK